MIIEIMSSVVPGMLAFAVLLFFDVIAFIATVHVVVGYISRVLSKFSSIASGIFGCVSLTALFVFAYSWVGQRGMHEPEQLAAGCSVAISALVMVVASAMYLEPIASRRRASNMAAWNSWIDGDAHQKLVMLLKMVVVRESNWILFISSGVQLVAILTYSFPRVVGTRSEEEAPMEGGEALLGLAILLGIVAIIRLIRYCFESAQPQVTLLHGCMSYVVDSRLETRSSEPDFRVGRWRNSDHERYFRAAKMLDRQIPALRKRCAAEDFKEISRAYSALGSVLRNEAVRSRRGGSRGEVLLVMAVTLAVNDDLLRTSRRIASVIPLEYQGANPVNGSRVSRMLSSMDDFLVRNTRLMVSVAVIAVAVYYVSTGQFNQLVEFIRARIGV